MWIKPTAGSFEASEAQIHLKAEALAQDPSITIFDGPTRGVDVGAISVIPSAIGRRADEGEAVIVISSYLPGERAAHGYQLHQWRR